MLIAVPVAAAVILVGLGVRMIVRENREQKKWQAEREQIERLELVAYHARRAREIGDALRGMGDDAQYVFPARHNGS